MFTMLHIIIIMSLTSALKNHMYLIVYAVCLIG